MAKHYDRINKDYDPWTKELHELVDRLDALSQQLFLTKKTDSDLTKQLTDVADEVVAIFNKMQFHTSDHFTHIFEALKR
tara:strand:- start:370 stop:606 length:237 start_codon:yes stop_codon:yes gene_type:complete